MFFSIYSFRPENPRAYVLNDILTNLGPTSVDLIFYAPKEANIRF